jgi:hypothetical protein
MTERKARAKATATADSPEGNDRKKSEGNDRLWKIGLFHNCSTWNNCGFGGQREVFRISRLFISLL